MRVRDVKKNYELPSGGALLGGGGKQIKAVQDLSFEARQKQIVAIVGESGCGKSTFAKVLMGLENGNGGSIVMRDENLAALPVEKRSDELIGAVQMVFQNPNDTLNPTHTVGRQIARSIRKLGAASGEEVERKVDRLLVVLPRRYASQTGAVSGGQIHRIGIDTAFAGQARLVSPMNRIRLWMFRCNPVIVIIIGYSRPHEPHFAFYQPRLNGGTLSGDSQLLCSAADNGAGQTKYVFAPAIHPYTESLHNIAGRIDWQCRE